MSLATLGGDQVTRARVAMPLRGLWHVSAETVSNGLGDGLPYDFTAPGLPLKGTSYASGVFAERATIRLVAGGGGLGTELRQVSYRRVLVEHVLADLMRETGEVLAATSDAAILATHLEKFTRPRATGAIALGMLLDVVPGATWRALDNGTIWVGQETWPVVDFDHQVLEEDVAAGRLVLVSAETTLRPGVTLGGRRVTRVDHSFEPSRVRTIVEYTPNELQTGDRLLGAIARVVMRITRGVRMHVRHVGKIVGVAEADGSVNVKLDGDAVLGNDAMPMRYGLPGWKAKVPAGTRCAMQFEEADPRRPVVVGFEGEAVDELAFDGGTKSIARVDDTIDAGTFIRSSAGVFVQYFPGTTAEAIRAAALLAYQTGTDPTATRVDLVGPIKTGNPKLKA